MVWYSRALTLHYAMLELVYIQDDGFIIATFGQHSDVVKAVYKFLLIHGSYPRYAVPGVIG